MRISVVALVAVALAAGSAVRIGAQQVPTAASVYTANTDGNTISALDGETLVRAHADIASGAQGPLAVAVSADQSRVYCSNGGTGGITVIDAATNEQLRVVGTTGEDALTDLVVAPDGSKVFATGRETHSVEMIDTVTFLGADPFPVPPVASTTPDPEAIDISHDGTVLFVLDVAGPQVVKMSSATGASLGSVAVSPNSKEMKLSADGATVIVVGDDAPRFFDASNLAPVGGVVATDLGSQVDLAVAGADVFVLNTGAPAPTTAKPGPKGFTTVPTIDVYVAATGGYVKSIPLGTDPNVLGIAVLSDGSIAFVSRGAGVNPGSVTAVDLVTGVLGPTGNTDATPRRVAVATVAPATPIVSYFLPRNINLKLKGAGTDSLIAAGFYDDGGPRPDYTQPVTIDVGGFTKTFTLLPKGKSFVAPKDPVVKFFILPNLRGSSRGRFKMQLKKASLTGLVDPEAPVEFHFRATGLPDCQGKVQLLAGRYTFGRKRGALFLPQFFPQRSAAKVGGAPSTDTLFFVGGFATNGQTPNALTGLVRFAYGPAYSRAIAGSLFKKAGDKFKYTEKVGKSVVFSMTFDFLRESVTVSAKKVELGDLNAGTTDVVFDAGIGAGTFRNTVKVAASGSKRFY